MTLSGWGVDIVGDIQIISPTYFKNRLPKSAFGYDEYYHKQNSKKITSVVKRYCSKLMTTQNRQPTFYDIFMFNCLRSKTYTSRVDRDYWEEKGWLDADYFYPIKMNSAKRIFGHAMKGFVYLAGARYLEK